MPERRARQPEPAIGRPRGGRSWPALVLGLALLLASGCVSYNRDLGPAMQAYRGGSPCAAAEQIDPAGGRKQDRLLLLLEKGKALHDCGQFARSAAVLSEADRMIEQLEQAGDVVITEELAAAAFDQTARPFVPGHAERILLSTIQAMNLLAMGDLDEARVHLRRAHDRQVAAVQQSARQIESAQREARRRQLRLDRALAEAQGRAGYQSMAESVGPAYADYANPLTSFLAGLVSYVQGDWSNARVEMRKAAAMTPGSAVLRDEAAGRGYEQAVERDEPVVYVIHETGLAPAMQPLQVPIVTSGTGLSVAPLPIFGSPAAPPSPLRIGAGERSDRPQRLASVTGILATAYHDRLPIILLRTAVSVAGKEVATQHLRKELGDAGLLLGSLYKGLSSSVDLRTWRTLGAEYQLARLPRPDAGYLTLDPAQGSLQRVELPPAKVVLVLVREVGGRLPRITAIPLGPPLGVAASIDPAVVR